MWLILNMRFLIKSTGISDCFFLCYADNKKILLDNRDNNNKENNIVSFVFIV
jgi:hypothetical protein